MSTTAAEVEKVDDQLKRRNVEDERV